MRQAPRWFLPISSMLGTIHFPLSQAPRTTAWKNQPAQAFEGLNTHIQALDITEEAETHLDSQTKAYVSPRDGTSSAKTAHDNPKAEKDSTFDAAPALSAFYGHPATKYRRAQRYNDGHAATPKRESISQRRRNKTTQPRLQPNQWQIEKREARPKRLPVNTSRRCVLMCIQ